MNTLKSNQDIQDVEVKKWSSAMYAWLMPLIGVFVYILCLWLTTSIASTASGSSLITLSILIFIGHTVFLGLLVCGIIYTIIGYTKITKIPNITSHTIAGTLVNLILVVLVVSISIISYKSYQVHVTKAKAAQAKPEAEARANPRQGPVGTIEQEMVTLPAGEFRMGCSPGDNQCYSENPPHRVKIKSFRIGKYEVTQAQWRAVMGANPAGFKGDDRPVENVSWNDIQDFLERLNAGNPGKPYRLPTEAEWEYAARAGTETPYWWGRDLGTGHANCDRCGSRWDGKDTAPVGSFRANPFGLYDTAGNVWEWVADCWHDSYQGAPADGSEWRDNCHDGRVRRGGSWKSNPRNARVSYRLRYDPANRFDFLGLRLAQDL